MHSLAKRNAQRFLSLADRMFGERLVGFYIVGSAALGDFRPEWHPIIEEALAYWRGEPANPAFSNNKEHHQRAGEFALHVIQAANEL